MFTGIVEELGEVVAAERTAGAARITVSGPRVTIGAAHGDSIAVNGACLTVTGVSPPVFTADVMPETLARTGLGELAPGSRVNLERPLRLSDRLGGHLVQGHVDAVATVLSRSPGGSWDVVRISVPAGLGRYIVEKGSVAVDGVSLTVSAAGGARQGGGGGDGGWFEVSLTPTTLALTTLGLVQPGSHVNLEVDLIGKYVARLLGGERGGLPQPAVRP
jgi:riboflavin synthase